MSSSPNRHIWWFSHLNLPAQIWHYEERLITVRTLTEKMTAMSNNSRLFKIKSQGILSPRWFKEYKNLTLDSLIWIWPFTIYWERKKSLNCIKAGWGGQRRYDNWNTLLLLPLKKVIWLSPEAKTQWSWWRQTQSQHFCNTLHCTQFLPPPSHIYIFFFLFFLMANPGQCVGHFIFHLQSRNEIVYYLHHKNAYSDNSGAFAVRPWLCGIIMTVDLVLPCSKAFCQYSSTLESYRQRRLIISIYARHCLIHCGWYCWIGPLSVCGWSWPWRSFVMATGSFMLMDAPLLVF